MTPTLLPTPPMKKSELAPITAAMATALLPTPTSEHESRSTTVPIDSGSKGTSTAGQVKHLSDETTSQKKRDTSISSPGSMAAPVDAQELEKALKPLESDPPIVPSLSNVSTALNVPNAANVPAAVNGSTEVSESIVAEPRMSVEINGSKSTGQGETNQESSATKLSRKLKLLKSQFESQEQEQRLTYLKSQQEYLKSIPPAPLPPLPPSIPYFAVDIPKSDGHSPVNVTFPRRTKSNEHTCIPYGIYDFNKSGMVAFQIKEESGPKKISYYFQGFKPCSTRDQNIRILDAVREIYTKCSNCENENRVACLTMPIVTRTWLDHTLEQYQNIQEMFMSGVSPQSPEEKRTKARIKKWYKTVWEGIEVEDERRIVKTVEDMVRRSAHALKRQLAKEHLSEEEISLTCFRKALNDGVDLLKYKKMKAEIFSEDVSFYHFIMRIKRMRENVAMLDEIAARKNLARETLAKGNQWIEAEMQQWEDQANANPRVRKTKASREKYGKAKKNQKYQWNLKIKEEMQRLKDEDKRLESVHQEMAKRFKREDEIIETALYHAYTNMETRRQLFGRVRDPNSVEESEESEECTANDILMDFECSVFLPFYDVHEYTEEIVHWWNRSIKCHVNS